MWTDDRVETLKTLWAKGLSASQIARQLGEGVTRNAVIGKVHRLGLSGRGGEGPQPRRTRPVRVTPSPPRRIRPAPQPPRPAGPAVAARARPEMPEEPGLVRCVSALHSHMCRWPIGDPRMQDFTFCGAPAVDGAPYCADHSRQAFRPVTLKPIAQDPYVRRVLAGQAA